MPNRILARIADVSDRIALLDADAVAKLDTEMSLDFGEHFAYQNAQASAHASGILTTEEASVIYRALGEGYGNGNGGWKAGTDTATKVVCTLAIGEIIARR